MIEIILTIFTIFSSMIITHDLFIWYKSKKLSKKLSSSDSFLDILTSLTFIDSAKVEEIENIIKIKINGYSIGEKIYSDIIDSNKYKTSILDKFHRKIFYSNKLLIIIDAENKKLKVKFNNNESFLFKIIVTSNEIVLTNNDIKEISNFIKQLN